MKKTFFQYRRLVIGFLLLFIPLMFISFYKIDYSFTAPGFNDDISQFIIIEEELENVPTFMTTSVIVMDKISIAQYLLGRLESKVTVDEFPEIYDDLDLDDLNTMGYLMKDDSLATSLIVGIENAGYSITYETYLTIYMTLDFLTSDSLMLGDKILEINGNTDLDEALSNIECETVVEFKILRDDVEMTVHADKKTRHNGTCAIGVYLYDFTEIIETEVVYKFVEDNTGGPSGGLMQALYVYFELTESNFDPGLRIAGTGTIDVDGNVGGIGGVRQKIITASMNNIDIFFIPHLTDGEHDNYIEALEVYNTLDTDMELVGVATFQEALDYLLNLENGDTDEWSKTLSYQRFNYLLLT